MDIRISAVRRTALLTPVAVAAAAFLLMPPSIGASREPRLQLGEPTVIYGAVTGMGQLLSLSDGSLALAGVDFSLRSTDHGKTWFTQPPVRGVILGLRDKSYYVLGGAVEHYLAEGRTRPSGTPGLYLAERWLAKDAVALFSNSHVVEEISVKIDHVAQFTNDLGGLVGTPFIAGPLAELNNGDLLALTYGKFVTDTVPIPGFIPTKGERWFRNRTYVLSSKDKGRTWQYLTTAAYDGDTGQESFCEPAMLNLGNDELLIVMRTGRFAPMYMVRSLDGGKTWSKPESMHILGLSPQLAQLSSGAVVCTFGWRPFKNEEGYRGALADYKQRYVNDVGMQDPSAEAGDYFMISNDKGKTWSKPVKIAEPLTVGYTRVAPTGPRSFLAVTQRITIPGESNEAVLRIWRDEWAQHADKSKRMFVAREVTLER
jgi:hypothetical protein